MNWHRYFGLLLTDVFTGSPFVVELEKDLSLKKQLLDVAILRRVPGELTVALPDGLDNLAPHNLLTFKSHREALDGWAVKELNGHYVNYRKQVSPSFQQLLPETDFRLYAVCARFPDQLATQVPWHEVQQGVYDCRWGTDTIRVLVLRQLPPTEANAGLLLFSLDRGLIQYGQTHYRPRSPDSSSLLYDLLQDYRQEGLLMPYTMEDYRRDFRKRFVQEMTQEEWEQVLNGLPPEKRKQVLHELSLEERKQVLHELPPEERLEGLSPEKRLEGLSPEKRLEGLSPEQILKLLPPEAIEGYLKRQKYGAAPASEGDGG